MKITVKRFSLKLRHAFTISRGSRTLHEIVLLELEHDGIIGLGEASPSARYGETVQTVETFFEHLDLSPFKDPFQLEAILTATENHAEGNTAAKAALDIALHDWIGKKLSVPLYRYWGLDRYRLPMTSMTIGIDTPEVIELKVREAEEFPILKIKLGGENDEEIIKTIRGMTKKTLRVDANEGWKTRELAVEKIHWLEQEGVEFVEQPMPASDLAGTAWVRERVSLPLIADENSLRIYDVPTLQGAFDGINIKLMKCTGLREAQKMIHTARACRMNIMLGCMIESSIAITAAAHCASLVDYADLDGNILVANDPFRGVKVEKGKLLLPDRPGLGVLEHYEE